MTLWHLPESQDLLSSVMGGDSDEAMAWTVYSRVRREARFTADYLGGGNLWTMDPAFKP